MESRVGESRQKFVNIHTQGAQMSHRSREMLRVIEYFAKSLKIIRNDTAE